MKALSTGVVALEAAALAAGIYFFSVLQHMYEGPLVEEGVIALGLAAYVIMVSGSIASRLGIPPAIVEMFAGVGAAAAGVHGGPALHVLSGIGANILLFMAGLEVEIELLKRSLGRTLALGGLVWGIPALLIAGLLWGRVGLDELLLYIAAFSTTSVAITFTVLKTTRLLRSEHGQAALTAAMVTDVLGMIALNLATAVVDVRLALYSIVLLAALVLQPLMPKVSGRPFELELRIILMAIIVLGAASEILGVHSVLTSFILGVVVGETVRSRRLLMEKLEGLATGFFTPFFFVAAGMSVKPDAMVEALLIGVAAGLLVYASKTLPAYAYYRLRAGVRPRARAFLLASSLSPLLTVSVVGAVTGYQKGLIDAYGLGVIMTAVMVTTTLAVLSARLAGGVRLGRGR